MLVVTNSTVQSPREANSHSANQEILRLLWNPQVHYRIYKIPQLASVLSQMHPIHGNYQFRTLSTSLFPALPFDAM